MKKKSYIQPHVKVAKMEMEDPIAYSDTATVAGGGKSTTKRGVPFNGGNNNSTEGTHNGADLGAKGSSFDFDFE